jgi:hypothetical protein
VESHGPITKLNAEIDAGTASEAKNPAVRLGFSVSEGQDFFRPRTIKRKYVSWRFQTFIVMIEADEIEDLFIRHDGNPIRLNRKRALPQAGTAWGKG